LILDAGATKAIQGRKSLLAVGVRKIKGNFDKGDVIELCDAQSKIIALARAKQSSESIKNNLSAQNFEVAHADEIVIV
jgi:glutamate 5-kinase